MTNTMNPAADALATIRAAHASDMLAAATISDYLIDPAAISSPSLISAIDTIIALGADDDPTTIAESLAALDTDFAKAFCFCEELCAIHFSDPEVCITDH